MFYDVAGSIFVAGWSEGFLGGRERSHWVLKSYIFFTIGRDVDCWGNGPAGGERGEESLGSEFLHILYYWKRRGQPGRWTGEGANEERSHWVLIGF